MKIINDIARKNGVGLLIEPLVGEVVSNSDAAGTTVISCPEREA